MIKVETVLDLAFLQRHRWRWVYQLRMATVCWCQTKIRSVSGNLNRRRPPPLNKEPQKRETLNSPPRLQLPPCVRSPVLTCIRGRLTAEHRPIGSFYHDVTLGWPRGSPGSWMPCRKLSNHVQRFPWRPQELYPSLLYTSGFELSFCMRSLMEQIKSGSSESKKKYLHDGPSPFKKNYRHVKITSFQSKSGPDEMWQKLVASR